MKYRLLPVLTGALLLAACLGQAGGLDAAHTAAVQTLDEQLAEAKATLNQQTAEAELAARETDVAIAEQTSQAQDAANTATAAAAATFAAIEPQVIAPNGAVCRFGPNPAFAQVAQLTAGEATKAIALSTDGQWWQVLSQDEGSSECWVFWSADLEFLGDVLNLPTLEGPSLPTNTPAPTKPPGYSLSFNRQLDCSNTEYVILTVTNNGPDTYESAIIEVVDVANSTQLKRSDGNNEFLPTPSSCPKGDSAIGVNQTKYLSAPIEGIPGGTLIRINVRLCTENGYKGDCLNRHLQFNVN